MLLSTGNPSFLTVEPLPEVVLLGTGTDSPQFLQFPSDHYDHLAFREHFQSMFVKHALKRRHSRKESGPYLLQLMQTM